MLQATDAAASQEANSWYSQFVIWNKILPLIGYVWFGGA